MDLNQVVVKLDPCILILFPLFHMFAISCNESAKNYQCSVFFTVVKDDFLTFYIEWVVSYEIDVVNVFNFCRECLLLSFFCFSLHLFSFGCPCCDVPVLVVNCVRLLQPFTFTYKVVSLKRNWIIRSSMSSYYV